MSEPDPVFSFNKEIIDATRDLCVSYKINTAFYEAQGLKGWATMEKTVQFIGDHHFKIADAKRGDIGNTSNQYAKAFFEAMPFDAVTFAPYMGADSVKPFLQHKGKWAIVLGLTSNEGAQDFEMLHTGGEFTYEKVIEKVAEWGSSENLMFVVGATQEEAFESIRKQVPDHFFLVPGVGAQGGDLEAVSKAGMNSQCGLLVNSSRSIIYASSKEDFADAAQKETQKIQQEMREYLDKFTG